MKLSSVHADCIWCDRRLVHRSVLVDCKENFGPRPRSDEHIIPGALFGKLITDDLCKCCNSHFGSICDHALVKDQKIVEAAKKVGIKETDLWTQFEGIQLTPRGREVKIAFNKGVSRPKPELRALDKLTVPIIDGVVSEQDLVHFGARLSEKVRAKRKDLTNEQIQTSVNMLLEKMRLDPGGAHHDALIGETVQPTKLSSQITYKQETKPWETQWCLAKIVFELSQLLWPKNYRAYFKPVFHQWRFFLENLECSPDGKQGIGIFKFEDLPAKAATSEHVIEGIVSPTEMCWSITFFGTARWWFDQKVKQIQRPPDPGCKIKIVNPIGNPSADAVITITPLD
jgi:HNH endonuclease